MKLCMRVWEGRDKGYGEDQRLGEGKAGEGGGSETTAVQLRPSVKQ